MAIESVPEYYRKAFQDFTGGLMTRPNALMVPANKFVQLDNAIINDSDILEKAPGYVLDGSPFPNSTDSFIRMLINFKVGTSVNNLICAAQDSGNANANFKVDLKSSPGNGVYSYIGHTTGTATFTNTSAAIVGQGTLWTKHLKAGDKIKPNAYTNWIEIQSVNTDTSITLVSPYSDVTVSAGAYMARIVLNRTAIPESIVFNNKLIIVNGSDTPLSFDNVTLTKHQSANIQLASKIEKHKNRVFMANWPGSSSGLLWTYANDDTTIDAASKTTVFSQDNGNCVGIKSFANSLLMFKDNGLIYQIAGEFDQDAIGQPSLIRKIDVPDNIGVIAGRSVVILDDNTGSQGYQRIGSHIYFLSETGIYTINSWMQVSKISWDIAPTILNLILKSTVTATKAYNFTAKSQWDSGTNVALGTDRLSNGLSSYFDTISIVGARKTDNGVSSAIDSSNNVHTAFLGSDGVSVWYNKFVSLDNTSATSNIFDRTTSTIANTVGAPYANSRLASGPDCVAIAVAPNGNIGIASKYRQSAQPTTGGGTTIGVVWILSEFVSGSWVHTAFLSEARDRLNGPFNVNDYNSALIGIDIKYTAASNPQILVGQSVRALANGGNPATGITWCVRTAGVWAATTPIDDTTDFIDCCFVVDSTNVYVAATGTTNRIVYWKSSDSGASFVSTTTINPAGTLGVGKTLISVNQAKNPIITYNFKSGGATGFTYRYNAVSAVTTIVDGVVSKLNGYSNNEGNSELFYISESMVEKFIFDIVYKVGTAQFVNASTAVIGTGTKWTTWVKPGDLIRLASDVESTYGTVLTVNSDTSIALVANYTGTSSTAAYVAKRTISVSDTSGIIKLSDTYRSGASCLSQNSVASIISTAGFGANANEIIIRRVTLFGKWTSPVESDATLSSWSTYQVGNPIANGNTITYEVGLSTSSSILVSNTNTITPGSVISTDPTQTYAQATVTFLLGNFAQSSMQSLIMNYVGAGADAILPTGYVFNNEMYLAVTDKGNTGNDQILFLDRKGAWGDTLISVSAMTRYNQQLYAGSSTNGNIYKLKQGYNFNGSAYSLTAITKEDLLGSIELQKDIQKIYIIYKTQQSGSFTFSYRLNNYQNPGSATWVDSVIDQTKDGKAEVTVGDTAYSIQFKISQNDADVKVGIVGFIVLYGYLGVR